MKWIDWMKEAYGRQWGEVFRFGVVGVTATALQYGVYWVLIHWLNPFVAMTAGYVTSFVFNFIASTRYTFRVAANARHGIGFVFSHAVNYLLQMITLHFFLWLGVGEQLAPIPVFAVCVPVNFLLVRFFLKR